MLTSLSSCLLAVDLLQQITGSNNRNFKDTIKTQKVLRGDETEQSTSIIYKGLKSIDEMGPGLSSGLEGRTERVRGREGGYFGNMEAL